MLVAEGTITTGVDSLLTLLQSVDKISLVDAAKKLGISQNLIQSWVDFLVEEEIVGIEYKFTKPIIYLNKPPEGKKAMIREEEEALDMYKEDFKKRASQKNIPQEKISFLWKNHVTESLNRKRDFFVREAKKRNLSNIKTLWKEYEVRLLAEQ